MKTLKRAALPAAVFAITAIVSGCAGGAGAADNSSQSVFASSGQSEIGQEFFQAIASNDLAARGRALELTFPGSDAEAYAAYWFGLIQAESDRGWPSAPNEVRVIQGGQAVWWGPHADDCAEFTGLIFEDGKLSSFSAGGVSLSGSIVKGEAARIPFGNIGSVSLVAAYRTISGAVAVVLEIHSYSDQFRIGVNYVTPAGRQQSQSSWIGPLSLANGTHANGIWFFDGAEFGGNVVLTGSALGVRDSHRVTFSTLTGLGSADTPNAEPERALSAAERNAAHIGNYCLSPEEGADIFFNADIESFWMDAAAHIESNYPSNVFDTWRGDTARLWGAFNQMNFNSMTLMYACANDAQGTNIIASMTTSALNSFARDWRTN